MSLPGAVLAQLLVHSRIETPVFPEFNMRFHFNKTRTSTYWPEEAALNSLLCKQINSSSPLHVQLYQQVEILLTLTANPEWEQRWQNSIKNNTVNTFLNKDGWHHCQTPSNKLQRTLQTGTAAEATGIQTMTR